MGLVSLATVVGVVFHLSLSTPREDADEGLGVIVRYWIEH